MPGMLSVSRRRSNDCDLIVARPRSLTDDVEQSPPAKMVPQRQPRRGRVGVALPSVADGYLGLRLLLLAHPDLAASWQTMMSLGGVTKARKITGREFPVWVDLPAHQPALLSSPVLARVEGLFAEVPTQGREGRHFEP